MGHNDGMRFAVVLCLLLVGPALAADWPQWRGPSADGHSPDTNPPLAWSDEDNVAWKAPIEGWGTSTPIVSNGKIFLTSQIGDGPLNGGGRDFAEATGPKAMEVSGGVRFVVKAVALADGKTLWEKSFPAGDELPSVHIKHNLASPSCVTDGKTLYAWFGTGVVLALSMDGDLLWRRNLAAENRVFDVKWGHGSSPTLRGDKLYLLVDHPGMSYLLAVDKNTGKDLWRSDRGDAMRSYTTPFVLETDGGDQLLVNTNAGLQSLDADDGDLLWTVGEENRVPVAVPVVHNGVIYSSRGYNSSPYLAVVVPSETGGGRVQPKWRTATGAPYISSVVYENGLLFMATERGIASAVDAETGEVVWKQRLSGSFSASPIVADGKVYFVNESGVTYVVAASRDFQVLAKNDLGERTLASPALVDGTLLIRTDDHLFAIRERNRLPTRAVERPNPAR